MNQELWTSVEQHLAERLVPPDPLLEEVLNACVAAGLPAIHVSPNEGKLLHLLARIHGARKILEIGTLGGYSTVWLARALQADGRLITLELDPTHAEVAQANFNCAGVADRIELRQGPALEALPQLAAEGRGPFDLIFIDADKASTAEYFEWAMRLSQPGSLIIADNVVRDGEVINADSDDPHIQGIRRFLDRLAAEPRVAATAIQTVGSKGYDGFVLALVTASDDLDGLE